MNIERRGLWAPLLFATLFVFGQPAIADESETRIKAETKTEAKADAKVGTQADHKNRTKSKTASAAAKDLERDAEQALQSLVANNSVAAEIAEHSEAVLVFPSLVKAGLVFGGAYGEGVLLDDGKVEGYFNSVTASWGLQAGAQSYSYVVFLMTEKAISYLDRSSGWELGVGPTLVVVNEGVAKNLSTSTLKEDSYAFIFDQQGVMGSLSIEGTKITRIDR